MEREARDRAMRLLIDHLTGKRINAAVTVGDDTLILELEDGSSLRVEMTCSVGGDSNWYRFLRISVPGVAGIQID